MLAFGGLEAVRPPATACANVSDTDRCSISKACVFAPGRMSAIDAMSAASGVSI